MTPFNRSSCDVKRALIFLTGKACNKSTEQLIAFHTNVEGRIMTKQISLISLDRVLHSNGLAPL